MALPINIHDLISGHTVEWDRLEFKAGWNPEEVLHTLCAFANDINNWGGGYIVIGIEEQDGRPILPPKGLNKNQIDKIQKELIQLTNCIDPFYSPVTEPAIYQGKQIFIIWGPGGFTRPYKTSTTLSAKGQKQYYIRRGSTTVVANHTEIKQLMSLAATVPFDDRINHNATIKDLDLGLIREFLQEIGSELFEEAVKMPFDDLCRQMRIAAGSSEYFKPLNVGLLFFNNHPETFFRGAITEIVIFKDDASTEFEEIIFKGPLHRQARAALSYIRNNIIKERIIKVRGKAEALRFFNYPYEALEEVIINAYYHRSYEHQSTVEISIHPDRIDILSFPGPLPPNDNDSFKKKRVASRDYRNRRIGDFLKELDMTEGRCTGIPKVYRAMEKNGSPNPVFEIDKDRVSFLVTLPIHGAYLADTSEPLAFTSNSLELIMFCSASPRSKSEIAAHLDMPPQSGTLKRLLSGLIAEGVLEYTMPEKPNSRLQQYRTATKGYAYLDAGSR